MGGPFGDYSPISTAIERKPPSNNRLESHWVALVVPDQWGTAAVCPALVGYDQWHPKSGEDRREVSHFAPSALALPASHSTADAKYARASLRSLRTFVTL